MKRTLILIPVLLLSSAAFAAAGPQAPAPGASGSAQIDNPQTGLAADEVAERPCLQQTGTRIVRRQSDGCVAGSGRSYDRRDLASTGQTRTGNALRMLDPAIR